MVGRVVASNQPEVVAGAVPNSAPLLEMRGISKRFPGVKALDGVSLCLYRGEVLALMGENGAGKSTLMKILSGAHAPDEGKILIDASPVQISSIAAAKAAGIAFVHQELMLAPNLDITSNIFLGNERTSAGGRLNRKAMTEQAQVLLSRVGLDVPAGTLVGSLTTAQMQMVEICKALNNEARIVIMDEPTSSLASHETDRLLNIIRELRRLSVSVVYISHRIGEVMDIADRISVLRDGREVGTITAREATSNKIVAMMVGRDLANWFPRRTSVPDKTVLWFDSVIAPGAPSAVSFDAKRGEILGFAGLVGSGRTELMEVLAGIQPPRGGTIRFEDQERVSTSPAQAIDRGICLVPEDRKLHGLVLSMSTAENIALPGLRYHSPGGFFRRKWQNDSAHRAVQEMQIRPGDITAKVVNLSGGNQQKVVLGKWLALRPKLLILDEPTRGIDIGAKAEIYSRIVALADSGITILLVSSDMEEILGLSDRVVVLRERRMAGILSRQEMSKQRIGDLMTGGGTAA
jgi:ribose transport system ATP-binding protein